MWRILKPATGMAVVLAFMPMALGDPGIVGAFQGVWIGNSVVVEKQMHGPAVTANDISITIRATDSGFEMTWKALYQDGAEWMTTRFVAAAEPGTFDLAGADLPLRGNETIRAEIRGDELVVYLVSAGDDRTERVSRYRRSVSDSRMTLDYTLTRDGAVLDSLTGILSKAKVVL
jgi:hypothetical protein